MVNGAEAAVGVVSGLHELQSNSPFASVVGDFGCSRSDLRLTRVFVDFILCRLNLSMGCLLFPFLGRHGGLLKVKSLSFQQRLRCFFLYVVVVDLDIAAADVVVIATIHERRWRIAETVFNLFIAKDETTKDGGTGLD